MLDELQCDPYPLYERARQAEGLTFVPELDAWLVVRQDEVRAVLEDPGTFSSANALRPDVVPCRRALDELAEGPGGGPVVVTADGDAHRWLREPLSRGLSPGRVAEAVPFITERAGTLVDEFAPDGRVELMERYARRLPGEVIVHLLGLPPEDAPAAVHGSLQAERLAFRPLDEDEQVRAAADVVALQRLLDDHVSRAARQPGDDLTGHLLRTIGTEPAQRGTLVSNLQNLLIAGHLTTTALIGNAVLRLTRPAELWELVCDRPELIPAAVDEAARHDAPVQGFRRVTTRPVALAGTDLPEGAQLFVAFGGANRDPTAHERPDQFDLTREPGRNFAFGYGAHACPGAQLAREQARITLETLTQRLPDLRPVPGEPVTMLPTLIHRSPRALPLAWTVPEKAA